MKKYKTALILGSGKSGQAAKRLLESEGTKTTLIAQPQDVLPQLDKFEVAILSPGFAPSHPWIEAIQAAGIPLLPEVELGWSRHTGKTIAVTGSNGKSSAVKWIADILKQNNQRVAIGGNYGIPACDVVLDHPHLDWLVLELSSFQLEMISCFRAEVSVLLNVLPNHLNRHKTMENYRKIKMHIFTHAKKTDFCLVPFNLLEQAKNDQPNTCFRKWVTFGDEKGSDFLYRDQHIFWKDQAVVDLSNTFFEQPILGRCTGAAVTGVAHACGVLFSTVQQAAQQFKPLPHRLEWIGTHNGVRYINDSKATNLAAMQAALVSVGSHIHLIAGGLPKETNFIFIKEMLEERVVSIYLIGQVSRIMYQAWCDVVPCVECKSLDVAFKKAQDVAKEGEVILLSPGCASFDQFGSFEERGDQFKTLFRELELVKGES